GILLGTRSEYTDELPLKTADTVLGLLSRPFVVGEHTVHISASIGIASGSDGCEGNCVLMAHGCDLLQGFYFSRPVPLKELLKYQATKIACLKRGRTPAMSTNPF